MLKDALPLGTILTLAATGSEMNAEFCYFQRKNKRKISDGQVGKVFPKFSIFDPIYTYNSTKDQTVYGIVDMMSHVFEQYFHDADKYIGNG